MIAGLITLGAGNYWILQLTLDIGAWQIVWPRVVLIARLSRLVSRG